MSRRFYEKDGNLDYLNGRTVAIIGYGSQGHAHALNLRDSGVDVVVGLYPGSQSRAKAEAAGLKVLTTAEAAQAADVVMILVADHMQGDLYRRDIAPHLTPGKTLMFAHGFNIHFNQIAAPAEVSFPSPCGGRSTSSNSPLRTSHTRAVLASDAVPRNRSADKTARV